MFFHPLWEKRDFTGNGINTDTYLLDTLLDGMF